MPTSLTTLRAKFDKLVSLETTNQATTHLHSPASFTSPPTQSEAEAHRSQYSQQKRFPKHNQMDRNNPPSTPCKGCGDTSHPTGKSMARKDCPAFSSTCHNCGILGHLGKVCRQPKQTSQPGSSARAAQSHLPSENASYLFAAQTTVATSQSDRKRLHRQQQRRRQGERALEAGISPNCIRKSRRHKQQTADKVREQETANRATESEFARKMQHQPTRRNQEEPPQDGSR